MRVKEKADLKLNIQKLGSWHPVLSLHGKQMGKQCKQWQILSSWAPKSLQTVTAAMKLKDTCCLAGKLWQTSCIKKQKHHFTNKGPWSQSYGFSSSHVRMWETIKKAERWRTDAFELWCWRRCLRFPWTARRSNQSILKEINPGYSSEGLMLKLQYLDHLMGTANSLEKNWCWERLKAKCSRRGKQRMRRLNSITDSVDVSLSKLQEIVKDREASSASTHGVTKSWIWLSNWTTTKVFEQKYLPYRIKAIQIKTLFRYMRDYLH